MAITGKISLYFHIPFCTKKCPYCHFYVLPDKEAEKDLLLSSFLKEWRYYLPRFANQEIVSIYFGGGTPSLFGDFRIKTLLDTIRKDHSHFSENLEVTLEANPENITLNLMQGYRLAGINRVSIGVQSFDDDTLQVLGRKHDAKEAIAAIYATRDSGIDNISIDLMYEIPHQKVDRWKSELSILQSLPITHLSLYNLTFEPSTLFYKKKDLLQKYLPTDEEGLSLLKEAVFFIEEAGLKRYEISAFCKDGFESIHNTGYWKARPFIGFGPSAFSYWEGKRFRNVCHLKRYAEGVDSGGGWVDFEEELDPEASLKELLAVNLRLLEGVLLKPFENSIDIQNSLDLLEEKGWIQRLAGRAKLTDEGMLFYDSVASEII